MAKYTENFNLIKPEDDEYYDVADFNENMDIIDEALAESAGGSDKIGEPEDSILSTVFGKLNGFISEDGQGVRIVKSIHRQVFGYGNNHRLTFKSPVNPERCIVLSERMYNFGSYLQSYSYTLEAEALIANVSGSSSQGCSIGFWVIEFY